MARLPVPGSDDGQWGDILNDFLAQAHNADGTLKNAAIAGAIGDATSVSKGVVQLAGDLGGTAAAPTVPGLASKAATTRQVAAGIGLTGGGDLTADRTLSVDFGSGATQVAAGNHTHLAPRQTQTWAWDGTAQVIAGTGRWYNRTGAPVTIHGVWVAVGTAPAGSSLIVDVHKNGTTIFTTQANRPAVPAGSNGGVMAVPDVTTVADGEYLVIDVDQVGSGTPGSDITVGVVYS